MGSICSAGESAQKVKIVKPTQNTTETSAQTDPIDYTSHLVYQISLNQKQTHKSSMTLILSLIKSYRHNIILPFWDSWKDLLLITATMIPEEDENQYLQEVVTGDVCITDQHVAEATEKTNFEAKTALRESPLFGFSEQAKKMAEVPMALTSLFRFFEEMMDKKYEFDVSNLAAGNEYCSIPDFYQEHLVKVYGLKKLAQKSMWQMLLTLKQLNDQSHSYGKLICSLLQVYDPYPIPNRLALFITKARVEMNRVIAAGKGKNKKLEEIQLVDAVELAYSLIPNDKYLKAKVVSLIKPKSMSEEEFLLFRIYNKMNRAGINAETMYNEIDTENEKRISLAKLVEYLKKTLEILIQDSDISTLSYFFSLKSTSKIPKYLFLSKLCIKPLSDYSQNDKLTIPKSTFLSSFIECYKSLQIRDTAYLAALFQSLKQPKVSQAEFHSLLISLDASISESDSKKYYEEGLLINSDFSLDGILQDSFVKIVLFHSIGKKGLRDFGEVYLGISFEDVKNEVKAKRLVKKSLEAFPERKERPRRPSQLGEASPYRQNRGSTPVDELKLRPKSPVFRQS